MRVASWVVAGVVLLGAGVASAQDMTGVLMKKADRLYGQRGAGKATEAVTAYEKVLAVDSKSLEARWKLSRAYYWIGNHARGKDAQMKAFETGIRYAQEAIQLDANCIHCHFWLGVSYGKFGEAKGVLQSLGLVPHIKDEMNWVMKADPKYLYGGAQRVLGRLYFKLPGFKGGDNKKSIELLRKACEIGPKDLMNHLFLVDTLLAENMKDEAKKELEFVINLPESDFLPDLIPESKEEQAQGKKLYEKHFGGK